MAHLETGLCLPGIYCPSADLGVGSGLTNAISKQAASSVIDALSSGLTQAADWLVGHVLDLIQTSTAPRMGAAWFGPEMALMRQVALVVLPVLMAATIGPVLRQDGRRLFRVWGVGLPVAVLAGLAGAQIAGWGLAATDALCSMVAGSHSGKLAQQFTTAMAANALPGAPVFIQMIVAVLTLCGAVLVWLELMVRSAGVYVATFFMPLALVAYIWPVTAGAAKRAVEILASLILSKFVIVASVSLGLAALSGGGVDATVSGAAVLLIAAFAPFALLRLAPVVEASAIAHLEGMSRRPGRAAARTVTAAAGAPVHPVTQLVMSTAGGASMSPSRRDGGLPARMVAAQPIPEAQADYRMGPPEAGDAAGTNG